MILSKPHANTGKQTQVADMTAPDASHIGGFAQFALPVDTYVWSKFSCELIAKPEAKPNIINSGSDAPFRCILECDFCFENGLTDKSLGKEQIVFSLNRSGKITVFADVHTAVNMKEVGGHAL